jgi:hypothetical protein
MKYRFLEAWKEDSNTQTFTIGEFLMFSGNVERIRKDFATALGKEKHII